MHTRATSASFPMRFAGALVVALLLSGCTWFAPKPTPTTSTSTTTTSTVVTTTPTTPTSHSAAGWTSVGRPREATWWLTTDHTLSATAPAAGAVATDLDVGFFGTHQGGDAIRVWTSDPMPTPVVLGAITMRIVFASDVPAASNRPAALTTWDWYAWLGDDPQLRIAGEANGPDTLQPGVNAESTVTFAVPSGGLVIPAGARLSAYAFPTYVEPKERPVKIVVGPSGSRVTALAQDITLDAFAPGTERHEHGTLQGHVAGQDSFASAVTAAFPVALPWREGSLRHVQVTVTPTLSGEDLDVYLVPTATVEPGKVLARGASPRSSERVDLFAPNAFDDGNYTIVVVNAGPQATGFDLGVRVDAAQLAVSDRR